MKILLEILRNGWKWLALELWRFIAINIVENLEVANARGLWEPDKMNNTIITTAKSVALPSSRISTAVHRYLILPSSKGYKDNTLIHGRSYGQSAHSIKPSRNHQDIAH